MEIHEIPRDYKGESRILYIFSVKALVYTGVGRSDRIIILFYF